MKKPRTYVRGRPAREGFYPLGMLAYLFAEEQKFCR